jgi:hypothetical protein
VVWIPRTGSRRTDPKHDPAWAGICDANHVAIGRAGSLIVDPGLHGHLNQPLDACGQVAVEDYFRRRSIELKGLAGARVIVISHGVVVVTGGVVVVTGRVVVVVTGGVVVVTGRVVVVSYGVVVISHGVIIIAGGVVVISHGVIIIVGGVVVIT